MKVSICQLHDEPDALPKDWERLVAHTHMEHSELVLLPEMPFFPWFPTVRGFNAKVWAGAVATHDAWEGRLEELAPAAVLGSRPIDFGNERCNAGFGYWHLRSPSPQSGMGFVHRRHRRANVSGCGATINGYVVPPALMRTLDNAMQQPMSGLGAPSDDSPDNTRLYLSTNACADVRCAHAVLVSLELLGEYAVERARSA